MLNRSVMCLPTIVGLLVLSGCTFARARINDPEFIVKAAAIEEGTTTSEQLVAQVGNPLSWVRVGSGEELYVYSYGQSKTGGLTMLIFNVTKTNLKLDTAFFVIKDGVVTEKYVGTNSEDVPWQWWAFGG